MDVGAGGLAVGTGCWDVRAGGCVVGAGCCVVGADGVGDGPSALKNG